MLAMRLVLSEVPLVEYLVVKWGVIDEGCFIEF